MRIFSRACVALCLAVLSTVSLAHAAGPSVAGWKYSLADEELEPAWSWKTSLQSSGAFETRIVFHYQNPQEYGLLRIVGAKARAEMSFWRVHNGQMAKWGEPAGAVALGKSGELTLQRTPWRARVLWNDRVVTAAYGGGEGGDFGVASQGAVQLEKERMQPTEPPFLRDDFMRASAPDEPEINGVWQPVAGVWKTSGLLNKRADSSRNPNPFVFRSDDAGKNSQAVAAAGYWWWNDYTVTASLRPTRQDGRAPLQAGLVAYHGDSGSGVAGLVDFKTQRASIVIDGHTVATGAPFSVDAGQWHRLFLDPGPGTIRLLVNGVERVRATNAQLAAVSEPAQGQAALISRTGGGNYVDFDDVRVAPNNALYDNFTVAAVGRWEDATGVWQTQTARQVRAKLTAGPALTLTGEPSREEGHVEAQFKALAKGGAERVGVAFGARDAGNYFTARRWGAKLEIVEYSNGSGKILAETKIPSAAQNGEPEIEVEWRDGLITAHSRGAAATAVVTGVPAGRVGAWADGAAKSVGLASFRALGAPPGWGEVALPEVFQKDRLMKYWASNAQAWQIGKDGVWWHTGDFFRDAALELPLPDLSGGKRLSLLLAATPEQPDAGTRLDLSRTGEQLSWQLFEGGKALKSTAVAWPSQDGEAPHLRIARRPLDAGRVSIRVALDDRVLWSGTAATQSASGAARKVGVRLGGDEDQRKPQTPTVAVTLGEQGGQTQMGVSIAPVTEQIQREAALPDQKGAYLQSVVANSPAAKAGFQTGDIIRSITIGGRTTIIEKIEELPPLIQEQKAGTVLQVKLWRNPPRPSFLDWEQVQATTSHLLDYTFTSAPVDWYAARGRWEVSERWTCSPQWGFFKGSASVHPTLWSRFATTGDWTLEAYLATPMDLARGERSPVDLNVTVDADGRDLATGYSFLFGANKRSANQIWRGDDKAVEKPFVLPKGAGDTHQDWFYVRLERRRTPGGLYYRYLVNDQLISEYTDPQPLPGVLDTPRHIAFWTYNGALSIARARLWYSGLQSGAVEDDPGLRPQPQTIANDLGEWRVRHADGEPVSALLHAVSDDGLPAVTITNPQSGGDWTVYITDQSFDAQQRPQLRFDYRVPRSVRVNLYALVDNRWREIIFADLPEAPESTAPAEGESAPSAIVPAGTLRMARKLDPSVTIGQIADVRDDGLWHSAEFDLLGALQKAGLATKVDALALAAPSSDYLQAGLGGNHRGATYWIRNFRAPANTPKTVASAP